MIQKFIRQAAFGALSLPAYWKSRSAFKSHRETLTRLRMDADHVLSVCSSNLPDIDRYESPLFFDELARDIT